MRPSESASGSSVGDMADSVGDLVDHGLPTAGDESGTALGIAGSDPTSKVFVRLRSSWWSSTTGASTFSVGAT